MLTIKISGNSIVIYTINISFRLVFSAKISLEHSNLDAVGGSESTGDGNTGGRNYIAIQDAGGRWKRGL